VLVALCAAGVVLALAPIVPVIRGITRLRARLQELRVSPFFVTLQSMQLQANRLSHIAERAKPLAERGNASVNSIQSSLKASGIEEARESLEESGASISALIDDLR
jgi:hypothetical protein